MNSKIRTIIGDLSDHESNYKKTKFTGEVKVFKDLVLVQEGSFAKGKKNGVWKLYVDANLSELIVYKKGVEVTKTEIYSDKKGVRYISTFEGDRNIFRSAID